MFENDFLVKMKTFNNSFIKHSSFENALEGIKECMTMTQYSQESVNCLLLGQPGSGKSSICKYLLGAFPSRTIIEDGCEIIERPVIFAEAPANVTPKKLASALLVALGDPNPEKGGEFNMTERLVHRLKQCRNRLLLLDEIHNLLDATRTSKQQASACQWLKGIINRSRCTVCLVGLEELADSLDAEIQRRFLMRYVLSPLSTGTPEAPGDLSMYFGGLAKTAKTLFELSSVPNRKDHHFINQLYVATGGLPSFVSALIREAIKVSKNLNKSCLDLEDISFAFDKGLCRGVCLITDNPFTNSPKQLAIKLGVAR